MKTGKTATALLVLAVLTAQGCTKAAEGDSGTVAVASACKLTPKEVVTQFVNELYVENKPREAIEKWVAEDYIQHNPMAPDGREAVLKIFDEFAKNPAFANLKSDVRRIIADGDLVAVHTHGTNGPDDRGFVVVDIWRVDGCKIAEHWDVMQPVPERSANGNTMY